MQCLNGAWEQEKTGDNDPHQTDQMNANVRPSLNIKNFIQNNLNSVTLKMLEDEFDLAYYEINSLDKDFKPAVFIKNSRKIKAQKMFFDKKSMSEIAQKTGYSETYLLKNKTKFINKKYNL